MAVEGAQIKVDPYTSTVPLIQIPREELQKNPEPAANYMGKAGGIAEIGNSILKGTLRGLQDKEQRKYATATATINALDKTTESAYQQYQEALATGKDKDSTDAAYDNYVKRFNDAKAQKAQFIIPQKPAKGQGGDKKKKNAQQPQSGGGFGAGIKQFFERNPHVIPELALATMYPKQPGPSVDTMRTKNQLQEDQNTLTSQSQNIEKGKIDIAKEQKQQALEDQKQKVDEAGGAAAVLKNTNAPPELQQAARRIQAEALDKESPEGQLRVQMEQDVLNGNSAKWTPGQKQLAGAWGLAPQPKSVKVMGKNGHEQEILVDPTTNQPIQGSKPLDLGPPAWAQEFYAKRAADKNDIKSAIAQNPTQYGIQLSGDKKTDEAKINAVSARLFIEAEEGIKSASSLTGKTGYEVQRDNGWLNDVIGTMKLDAAAGKSPFDGKDQKITYPGGKEVPLDRAGVKKIFDEFTQYNQGIRTFRDNPENPDGKSAEELEADRKWLQKYVENRGEVLKGKANIPGQSSEEILKSTALGRPITTTGSSKKDSGFSKPSFMDTVGSAILPGMWKASGEASGGGFAKPEVQQSAPQIPADAPVATDAAGNQYIFVDGQWLNSKTYEPYQEK
jgi:hypothetical protein